MSLRSTICARAGAIAALSASAALLGACVTSTSPRPAPVMPEHYARPASVSVSPAGAAQAAPVAPEQGYPAFGSAELDGLIARAERDNSDLAVARARVLQAAAQARAAGAAILPEIGVNLNSLTSAGHSGNGSGHETDWAALLTASYELDFWGANRAGQQSARLQSAAAVADRATVRLTTRAAVATEYFQVLALRDRLRLAQSDLDTLQQELRITEARQQSGLTGPVEVAAERAAVAGAQVLPPQLQQQEAEALASLALLVGQAPEDFTVRGLSLAELHLPVVEAGLPASLLVRRPDLVSAELSLKAAAADIDVARAALLPSLTLTLGGGVQNPAVQAAVLTIPGTGAAVNFGASLLQTVFDRGRRKAQVDLTEAREQELLAQYQGAVRSALVDVETALAAGASLDAQRPQLTVVLEQSRLALDGLQMRRQAGAADTLVVLAAERTYRDAQVQMNQWQLQRLQSVVGLCRALGGGLED